MRERASNPARQIVEFAERARAAAGDIRGPTVGSVLAAMRGVAPENHTQVLAAFSDVAELPVLLRRSLELHRAYDAMHLDSDLEAFESALTSISPSSPWSDFDRALTSVLLMGVQGFDSHIRAGSTRSDVSLSAKYDDLLRLTQDLIAEVQDSVDDRDLQSFLLELLLQFEYTVQRHWLHGELAIEQAINALVGAFARNGTMSAKLNASGERVRLKVGQFFVAALMLIGGVNDIVALPESIEALVEIAREATPQLAPGVVSSTPDREVEE